MNPRTVTVDKTPAYPKAVADLKKDAQDAQRLGLQGTPSFFINGHFMSGAIGYNKLKETVVQELAAANSGNKQTAAVVPLKSTENAEVKK